MASRITDSRVTGETFIGRKVELRQVLETRRTNFCIVGARRIGKTSLLQALKTEGLMTRAGERAFEEIKGRSAYAYERETAELSEAETKRFRADKAAWADFEQRPPSYRKTVLHWVTSAKKPETRERRLATLIEDSAAGRKIAGYDIGRKKT